MILTFSHALFGIWSSKLCGNAHDLFDHSYSSFHSFHTDVFEWTVETVTQAVHDHAFANGYTVVREIGGHGVGLEFHEEPWVGYNSKRGQEMLMVPGMIFTIEPMVNMGKVDIYVDDANDWEVYTEDGLPSAQWEIMVLVTEDGHEVLCW